MVRRIDVHAHFAPKEYLAAIRRFAPAPERLPDCSTSRLLESMERFRIDAAVLSLTPPGVFFGDLGQARELARLVNEHASQLRRDHPGRLAALGFLPLPDLAGSIEEAAYALDVLHLDGLELLTNVAGTYVGDGAWDPLFAELDRRAAYVFVHPCLPPYRPPLAEHPPWLYEFPFETTRAIANLVYSGTLEQFPNLRLHFAHLGGSAPFLAYRLASLSVREPGLAARAPKGALDYLRDLYLDTAQADDEVALTAALKLFSIDRIVFGTDWPYGASPPSGRDPAPGLAALGTRKRRRVEEANPLSLVPSLATSGTS